MHLQRGVFSLHPEDFPQVVEVWEASVRATHHFVTEADIEFFRPLVRDGLQQIKEMACRRDCNGNVVGFVAVVHKKVDMLFVDPPARGMGVGKDLLDFAVRVFGAKTLDVNEQNEQAVGFYLHMGFEVVGRSDVDGTGKTYPLLHMNLSGAPEENCEAS